MTIEDTAELRLDLPHVVRLEARPASVDGRGEVTIRALVRTALRMRPDRIIVGRCAVRRRTTCWSAATGHEGSLSTVHAGSPAEALRRVETLALTAGLGLSHAAIRAQVCDALDVIVHQVRRPGGAHVVSEVAEVVRVAGGAAARPLLTLRGDRVVRRPRRVSAWHGRWGSADLAERRPRRRGCRAARVGGVGRGRRDLQCSDAGAADAAAGTGASGGA